jgi:RNA polymerase sigma-70 factor (ECF subfamily)
MTGPNESSASSVEPGMETTADARPHLDEEAGLLSLARAGDVDAFSRLIDLHDRGLRALAFHLLGDRDRMDDALQEAYLNAFRALPSFQGRSAFGSWLYRIAYNACMDQLRRDLRRGGRVAPLDMALDRPDPAPDPADAAAGRVDLEAALASLSPDLRAIVLLVDAEGMDYAAAAVVLGVPVGTVRSRLHRARTVLRHALDQTPEGREAT